MSRYRPIAIVGALLLAGTTLCMSGCDAHRHASSLALALRAAPVCCTSPRELPFEPAVNNQPIAFTIDERSPVFAFPTGRSFFKAFALPTAPRPALVTLVSHAELEKGSLSVWTGRYFAPVVVYFDNDRIPSQPFESASKFLFDGQGRRFSVHQVPVAPEARYMAIFTDARRLDTRIQIPVDFAARDTQAIACGAGSEALYAGRPDMALLASAMCGLFPDTTVYAPPATWEWYAAIPYTAGGELKLWLSPPAESALVPAATR